MAMATAAAEPTVPGAHGERPQPNQVAMAKATRVRGVVIPVRIRQGARADAARRQRGRDHVFARRPIAQVDDAAALAAKREFGVPQRHLFYLAHRALHKRTASGSMCTSPGGGSTGAASVGASSVPSTS